MINKPPPFKGLNMRIPVVIPIKGRVFLNQGSGVWVITVHFRFRYPAPTNVLWGLARVVHEVEFTGVQARPLSPVGACRSFRTY